MKMSAAKSLVLRPLLCGNQVYFSNCDDFCFSQRHYEALLPFRCGPLL